jgi:hypothetical protein
MAQSLKHKVRKLAEQFNISAIISTAKEVQVDMADEAAWNALTNQQRLDWFEAQCKLHGLTIKPFSNQLSINEFKLPKSYQHPYFCVFLPKDLHEDGPREDLHLEIGSAYASPEHGDIWPTHPGLKGKEKQIAEVMRLRKELNI